MTFDLSGSSARKHTCPPHAESVLGQVIGSDTGTVTAWGAVSCKGSSHVEFLGTKQTPVGYVDLLTRVLFPFGAGLHGEEVVYGISGEDCYDHAVVRKFIRKSGEFVFKNPEYATDLNPALAIWCEIYKCVYSSGIVYTDTEHLKHAITSAWDNISTAAQFTNEYAWRRQCVRIVERNGS